MSVLFVRCPECGRGASVLTRTAANEPVVACYACNPRGRVFPLAALSHADRQMAERVIERERGMEEDTGPTADALPWRPAWRRAAGAVAVALGYVWALPVTLLGLVLGLVFLPRAAAWRSGALELQVAYVVPAWASAQTYGWVILCGPAFRLRSLEYQSWIRRHEHVHVRQCLWLGPLILLAYPLASLWAVISGQHYYRGNAFEKAAYRVSGE